MWATSRHHCVHKNNVIPVAVFQEDCLVRQFASEALQKIGQDFRIAYSSPNLAALLAVVGAGLAVAAMPLSSVPSRLKILEVKENFPTLPVIELALITAPDTSSEAAELLAGCVRDIQYS